MVTTAGAVKCRERIYLEHFWNDFAADPKHSVPEADRRAYAKLYAQPGGMRAGFEYFRNFERDAKDFAFGRNASPCRCWSGPARRPAAFLIEQPLVATDVQPGDHGAGYWPIEEAPGR
jgi:hypothetical protein